MDKKVVDFENIQIIIMLLTVLNNKKNDLLNLLKTQCFIF